MCFFVDMRQRERERHRERDRERAQKWVGVGDLYDISLDFTLAAISYYIWQDARFFFFFFFVSFIQLPLIAYKKVAQRIKMPNLLEAATFVSPRTEKSMAAF